MTPIFKGLVTKGKLEIENPSRLAKYLASLDGAVEVVIRKFRKQRSNEQNRYFHGVIVKMVADDLGLSPPEAKDMLKMMFLMVERNGIVTLRETSKLSTVEQEEFNEHCRRWAAAERGLSIPLPNEVDYDTYDARTEGDS